MSSRKERRDRVTVPKLLRQAQNHAPDCTRRDPHFVPPSAGQVGFMMCNPPDDITDRTREDR